MSRRQPYALRRHQVEEGIVLWRQVLVNRIQHVLVRVRAGNFQHARVAFEDPLRLGAEAARHDHAAVLLERLADGIERLIDRRVDESAGVDDHDVGRVDRSGKLHSLRRADA